MPPVANRFKPALPLLRLEPAFDAALACGTPAADRSVLDSKADFFFVVSSVNFMVPHVGSNAVGKGMVANKDDAWTVFLNEREQLIKF